MGLCNVCVTYDKRQVLERHFVAKRHFVQNDQVKRSTEKCPIVLPSLSVDNINQRRGPPPTVPTNQRTSGRPATDNGRQATDDGRRTTDDGRIGHSVI